MNLLTLQQQAAKIQRNQTLSIMVNEDMREHVNNAMECSGFKLLMRGGNRRIYCCGQRKKVDVVFA